MTDTAPSAREVAEAPRRVVISQSFDNLQSPDVRFLQEAARLGSVRLDLWSDALVRSTTGRPRPTDSANCVTLPVASS